MEPVLLDCAGRRRSPATLASFHEGRPPRNKGVRYPADPPTVAEIIAVMRAAGADADGVRLRGVIVVLWRAGLRISEALTLSETDLDRARGSVLVRRGKGGRRREVGMDPWGWEQLDPWLQLRASLPVGALFCILHGPTRGRSCSTAGIRSQLHAAAHAAGVRRRFAPHQLRHAHAVEMSREGVPLLVIRTRRPRHNLHVPAWDRQHRDHPYRQRTSSADDPRDQRPHARPVTGAASPGAPNACSAPGLAGDTAHWTLAEPRLRSWGPHRRLRARSRSRSRARR
ncbi:MAG: tyrosine-type recombinase/integrase [Solirubrobacteraceae bacterium]